MNRICYLAVLTLTAAAWPTGASAQTCQFPLCPSGYSYRSGSIDLLGPYGTCRSCNWLGHCSHTIFRCPAGSSLNISSGLCTHNVCTGGCGGELPLCDANETYTRSGTDAAGTYGVCSSGPTPPGGYMSHQLKRCLPGWTLQTATGQCRRDCLADLTFRRAFLRNAAGATVTSVIAYQPYYICFEVANNGPGASGPFQVRGGGLGVPVGPVSAQAGLAAGARRTSCLYYSTTPSPGSYVVGLGADATGAVDETIETNNTINVPVNVVSP